MGSLNVSGPYIKQARLSKKPPVTQEELAIRLQTMGWHVDRFAVSKIERGERSVTDKQLMMIAEALDIHPVKLLGN